MINVFDILRSKCPPHEKNIHFLTKYFRFIENCVSKNLKEANDIRYTEDHHICPKSKNLFPEYISFSKNPWNKAVLTGRQHAIAHWMLARAYGGNMWVAFHQILNCSNENQSRKVFSSRAYEEARIHHAKQTSERFKGRKHSEETKQKMRVSALASQEKREKPKFTEERKIELSKRTMGKVAVKDSLGNNYLIEKTDKRYNNELFPVGLGIAKSEDTKRKISEANSGLNHPNYGKTTSQETKDKISKSISGENNPMFGKTGESNANFGKRATEERKAKISNSKLGKPRKKVECPYCGKKGGEGIMQRWHFENCKDRIS